MKRTITTPIEEEEERIVVCFPPEIWLKVIGYVEKDDMATHLALLGVDKSFVHYVAEALDCYVSKVSRFFLERDFRTSDIPKTPGNIHTKSALILADDVINWIDHAHLSQLPLFEASTKDLTKAVSKMAFRYTSKCLLDERYMTAEHWSTLLSFLRLCQQHRLYVQGGDLEVLSDVDRVSTLFHIEKETERISSALKMPRMKTIDLDGTRWKNFEDLRKYAARVTERKYKENGAKRYLYQYMFDMPNDDCYVLFTTVFDVLKNKLKLREPRPDDTLSLVVIENEFRQMQHILADEYSGRYTGFFVYNKGDEHALATRMILKKRECDHCSEVVDRFTRKID